MSQTLTASQITKGSEPIAGYVLQECIGVGGNGEVWSATAPGGLTKAIKIIHGELNDTRAARELKSLNRIRGINHPFLLSIERIEIVDGHLLTVTEIAEGSLKDRFEDCRKEGLPGIPVDELRSYMRETADALDYLVDGASLQHLDVKPGNLLLASNHIKVADFGLLKDLRDNTVSLIGGFTPYYASPEVLSGCPSTFSDQYSLAIVYQEMLTGQRPFNGETTAHLASQHLNSEPDLSSLSPLERFAVAKALSKVPDRRFSSCGEFVDRLTHRNAAKIIMPQASPTSAKAANRSPGIGARPLAQEVDGHEHDGQTIRIAAPEIVGLPPVELDDNAVSYRPTLFIGIGGIGGRVLCRLKRQVNDRFPDAQDIPSLQFLYLDTDMSSITDAMSVGEGSSLQDDETLVLPLRKSREHCSEKLLDIASISRRWIYNIPRSCRTEGLRALGRVAMLDHSQRVLHDLRNRVSKITDRTNISATAQQTGLQFEETDPRIYVIASIAGGTGGGMVLDIGYAVRQVLAELGLSDDGVYGIFTYGTMRGHKGRTLAPANAYACLQELRYFSAPGNDYPGEPLCGLAGFREDEAVFKNTYLVDMGDERTEEQLHYGVTEVADYLFLNSLSPASAFFETCRTLDRATSDCDVALRTFGLRQLGYVDPEIPDIWIDDICRCVVRKWRGGIDAARTDDRIKLANVERLFDETGAESLIDEQIVTLASQWVSQLDLDIDKLAVHAMSTVERELTQQPKAYMRRVLEESVAKTTADNGSLEVVILETKRIIHAILDGDGSWETQDRPHIESLNDVVLPEMRSLGTNTGEALKERVLELVDSANTRVEGARQAANWLSDYVESLHASSTERLRSARSKIEEFNKSFAKTSRDPKYERRARRGAVVDDLIRYSLLLLDQLTWEGVCKTIGTVDSYLTSSSDELRDLWTDLNLLAAAIGQAGDANASARDGDRSDSVTDQKGDGFSKRRLEFIEQLDREIDTSVFPSTQHLREVLRQGGESRSQLIMTMRSLARNIILRSNKAASLTRVSEMLREREGPTLATELQECLEEACPELLSVGGAKRLLVVLPENFESEQLIQHVKRDLGDEPTVVCDAGGQLCVGYEVDKLAFDRVTASFITRRKDCQELARRLHTRVDIDWPGS